MTTTTTKTMTLTQAVQARKAATKRHTDAMLNLADAVQAAEDLRQRNASGDANVKGIDLLTADANVEAARGLADSACRHLDEARETEGRILADTVAADFADKYAPTDVDSKVEEIGERLTQALAELVGVLEARDVASDEAGQRLAEAGVPTGAHIGRVIYFGVPAGSMTDRRIPGKYNVWIDGQAFSRRDGYHYTRQEGHRLAERLLTQALRANKMTWGSYGVEGTPR